jgi:hypothetical protein
LRHRCSRHFLPPPLHREFDRLSFESSARLTKKNTHSRYSLQTNPDNDQRSGECRARVSPDS